MRPVILVLVAVAVVVGASCANQRPGAQTDSVIRRELGTWSGRGPMQTEPFISETGSLRLSWETSREATPGAGVFRVTVHSDVSGRSLVLAVDKRGVGRDVAYVSEDPRPFFLVIEAANLEWTLAADEGIAATVAPPAHR